MAEKLDTLFYFLKKEMRKQSLSEWLEERNISEEEYAAIQKEVKEKLGVEI
jgi:hypothetical protein